MRFDIPPIVGRREANNMKKVSLRLLPRLPHILWFTFVTLICLMLAATSHSASLSCDSQGYATIIGTEVVAIGCAPKGMNDNTQITYQYRDFECVNGVVTLKSVGNKVTISPNQIMNSGNGILYRFFRDKQGSYFLIVPDAYKGLIGDQSMSSYPVGKVYTGAFTTFIGDSLPEPHCGGGDANKSCEICIGSSVNAGTGSLSHDQELFTLDNNRSLSLGVSLYYNSLQRAPSAIGNGWSHTYEATLQPGDGSSMVFWENGLRRIYEHYTDAYVSPFDDHSQLTQNGSSGWTITEQDGLVRTFAADGTLTTITDRYGNTLTFVSTNGKLASVTDATGRAVTFGYNATSGKLETITDPAQHVHTLGYTGSNLTSYTPPGNKGQWQYTYGANGLLTSKQDPEQSLTSYTYDSDLRLNSYKSSGDSAPRVLGSSSSSDGTAGVGMVPDLYRVYLVGTLVKLVSLPYTLTFTDANGWVYTYDPALMRIVSKTDPYGKVTTYYYNPDATLRALTEPFDGTTRLTTFYTYDAQGNLLIRTEPADLSGYTTTVDPQSVDISALASLTPPITTAFSYTYDSAANYYQIKSITDNRGTAPLTATIDRYTETGSQGETLLVTKSTAPGLTAGSTTTSYLRQNSDGTIASITDENSATTTITYFPISDATKADGSAGLAKSVIFPDGIKLTVTGYDSNGNIIAYKLTDSTNADQPVKTTLSYDPLNQLTSILKESTITPARFPANLTKYGYDGNGNVNAITDPETRTTTLKYTGKGLISEITDARNKTTKLGYGASSCPSCGSADQLTSVRDANHVANNQSGTVYTYDKLGRLDTETDPLGKKLHFIWYDSGLLKQVFDATPSPEKLLITYTYNNRGQLTSKLYPDNTSVSYTYQANGWLTSANNISGSTVTYGYSLTYHPNGRLKSITDTNNRTIGYDLYDATGRRKQVTYFPTTSDQKQLTYSYDPTSGRLQSITSPAGVFTYGYDNISRRNSLTYPNQITTTYAYDDLQRLTGINYQNQTTPIATYSYTHDQVGNRLTKSGTANETYTYDEIYRLTQADTDRGTEKYTYDDVGNRLTGPGPKDTKYQFNAANQMLKGMIFGHDYDDNGNQTGRTTKDSDKAWTYTWDYENRLIKSEQTKGSDKRTITFRYDPFGRRIEKKLTATIKGTTKTTTWTYIYDGDDIALEIYTDPNNNTEKTFYTHGPGTDEHLALERNGSFFYYHADGLGSITAITDQNKAIVQKYDYDSFGNTKPTTSFRNSYAYTSREYDQEAGLYYYRARYYDPQDGRFISKDPIGFDGGDVNLYGYVQNNPVNWIDPWGLEAAFQIPVIVDPIPGRAGCNCSDLLDQATKKNNDADYGYSGKHGPGPGKNKCNAFVDDVLNNTRVQPRRWGGLGGPISAGTWADPNAIIPHFPVVKDPKPGDIVAVAHNYTDASGHVAIVVVPGKSSIGAGAKGSHTTGWPWNNASPRGTPVYRRCTCQ